MLIDKLKFNKDETIHFVVFTQGTEVSLKEHREIKIYNAKAIRTNGGAIQDGSFGLAKFSQEEYEQLLDELDEKRIDYKFVY